MSGEPDFLTVAALITLLREVPQDLRVIIDWETGCDDAEGIQIVEIDLNVRNSNHAGSHEYAHGLSRYITPRVKAVALK